MTDVILLDDLPESLRGHELISVLVAGANARAARVAPCLVGDDATAVGLDEARLVLTGAIKRWVETGSGAFQQQTMGPFGVTVDTRQRTGFNLWPSEIEALQAICATTTSSPRAFSFAPSGSGSGHLAWCSLSMGALWCSCGVDIAGEPIYELT